MQSIENLEKNGSKLISGDTLLSPFLPSTILLTTKTDEKPLEITGIGRMEDSSMDAVRSVFQADF
jgi:hypothetical protein